MTGSIAGINRTALWGAWKSIRQELKSSSIRDIVDYIEFDINPDKWIDKLLRRLKRGSYEPETPERFTLAKSNGFSRRMTMPKIPDLVLYRAVANYLYLRMRRFEHRHVYFERGVKPSGKRVARPSRRPANIWQQIADQDWEYGTLKNRTFKAWLAYDQYRKHLVFEKIHPFIVTTDITNYFDSILWSRVIDAFQSIGVPPRMLGLLVFLLERLSIRDAFTESPRIGLPVDEFGCSRKLAHLVLFPHDDRMTRQFGEDAFVRWMDDQNIGVGSYADGLRALSAVGDSLGRMHLTANSKKSRVLSIADARRHFHLDLNKLLDDADQIKTDTVKGKAELGRRVSSIWTRAKAHEDIGNWDKILSRIYRLAGLAKRRFLRQRAKADVLANPGLADRIADYVRCTGTVSEYVSFVEGVWSDDRQVYPDVNRVLVESLLRLEPAADERKLLRQLATRLLQKRVKFPGSNIATTLAPLLILRFADRRSLSRLQRVIQADDGTVSDAELRSCSVVYAGYGLAQVALIRRTASRMLRNHLSEVVLLFDSIEQYRDVPKRFNARISVGYDSLSRREFIDMRSFASARLLNLSASRSVKEWLKSKKQTLLTKTISDFDKELLERLWPG